MIVGIGYPTDQPFSAERHSDFTMPLSESELPVHPRGAAWPEQGGAEAFLEFIEEEVKPAMERDYPIDRGRQTIFGHSLGGLFVLQVLLTRPDMFQTYVAGSPSIHWNKRFIQENAERLSDRLSAENLQVSVLLAAGEIEKHIKAESRSTPRRCTLYYPDLKMMESALNTASLKERAIFLSCPF